MLNFRSLWFILRCWFAFILDSSLKVAEWSCCSCCSFCKADFPLSYGPDQQAAGRMSKSNPGKTIKRLVNLKGCLTCGGGCEVMESRGWANTVRAVVAYEIPVLAWKAMQKECVSLTRQGKAGEGNREWNHRWNPRGQRGLRQSGTQTGAVLVLQAKGLKLCLAKEGKHQVWHSGNGEQDIFGQSAVLQQCYNLRHHKTHHFYLINLRFKGQDWWLLIQTTGFL